MKMKVKRLHIYLTIVFLCAGYLIAFSYNYTLDQEGRKLPFQWDKEDQLRETLLEVQRENLKLEQQLREIQQRVSEKEEEMAFVQEEVSTIHLELESHRLLSGLTEAQGPGIIVTLEDSEYAKDAQNPNDYIIHEQDVRRVINEIFAAGAEGLSINNQRFIHSTAIRCVGPTIIVNNVKSAAPFKISAVGDSETLYQALFLPGGVVDALESWGISVKVEKVKEVKLPAFLGEI